MVNSKCLIRLLVLSNSPNETERLANLFRNHGQPARPYQVADLPSLNSALEQHQWDLIVASTKVAAIAVDKCTELVRKHGLNVPFIQLIDCHNWDDLGKAIRAGVTRALPANDDDCLLQVANQELANLTNLRQLQRLKQNLKESEERCQLLLDSSLTAIAYVHDGMHVYANCAYLRQFGYEDLDDLLSVPLMDLIVCDDQHTFRKLLKEEQLEQSVELACHCQSQDGNSVGAKLTLSSAHYEDEPCLQLMITDVDQEAALNERISILQGQDPLTGLPNRNRLIEYIDLALTKGTIMTLAYLQIDNLDSYVTKLGIAGSDQLQVQLGDQLKSRAPESAIVARVTDGSFAVLLPGTPNEQNVHLTQLMKAAQDHIYEVEGQSFQISVSGGVSSCDTADNGNNVYEQANEAARKAHVGQLKLYDPAETLAALAEQGDEVAAIKYALTTHSIRLLFQPVLGLRGSDGNYYEVIPMPLDSRGEPINTMEALRVVAEQGQEQLAIDFDHWVLERAIAALADQRSKTGDRQTRLIVPISQSSLLDGKLIEWLHKKLKKSELNLDALVLMLTETTVVSHLKHARELGKTLAADNSGLLINYFGKAPAPFKMLSLVPAKFVKIDSSLLEDLDEAHNFGLLKNMLDQVRETNVANIIPDVNSASALAQLWQAGAEYIQGDYIQGPSRPMDYHFNGS